MLFFYSFLFHGLLIIIRTLLLRSIVSKIMRVRQKNCKSIFSTFSHLSGLSWFQLADKSRRDDVVRWKDVCLNFENPGLYYFLIRPTCIMFRSSYLLPVSDVKLMCRQRKSSRLLITPPSPNFQPVSPSSSPFPALPRLKCNTVQAGRCNEVTP